ncbi:MAG: MucBP domain-containing protein [Vagococcus sp.]|uniref:MucBP domain-containing protein n=1 Tax=Vagococcus sp. TaxID=1933889 RepID=UPI002FCB0CB2
MKTNKKITLITFLLFGLSFILINPTETKAANYTAYSDSDLKTYLELPSSDTITLPESLIIPMNVNSRIKITGNKILDLNGNKINVKVGAFAQSGGFDLEKSALLTKLTIKNGSFVGGPTDSLGNGYLAYENKAGLFYADPNKEVTVTFQDISHEGDGFFKGRSADVIFKGENNLKNTAFNVRALNINMYANPNDENDPENTNFYGYVDRNGTADPYAQGTGGMNLTFDGYADKSAKSMGRTTKNLEVPKNAKVKLINGVKGAALGYLPYLNTIGNFAQINVNGELITEADGTPLRTTAAFNANVVGTTSDQSELNVKPGSVLKIYSLNEKSEYGTIYTYSVDINVDNPRIFDIRAYGKGRFFHGWIERNMNNFRLTNTDVAVWLKNAQGVGNPEHLWQEVDYITLLKFYYGDTGNAYFKKLKASTPEIESSFYLNDYSRISNDVSLPIVIPGVKSIGNSSKKLSGTTDYILPDHTLTGKKSPGATVTMKVNSITKTTKADANGNWTFDNLDLSRISGGSFIELTITDTDKRYNNSKDVAYVEVKDTIPPKANPVLVKTLINNYDFINKPENAISGLSDETDSNNNITKKFVDSNEKLKEKADSLGVKALPVSIKDRANNEAIIASTLLTTDNLTATGLVIGEDFKIPYEEWMAMTTSERRQAIISKGKVQGWTVTNDSVTEVTNDSNKLSISYTEQNWKPLDVVTITMKVGNYLKTIKATLDVSELKTTINYVDEQGNKISPETSKMMIPGKEYTEKSTIVPGYEAISVEVDGKKEKLADDKSIKLTMGTAETDIKFIYKSEHYSLKLEADKSNLSPTDKVEYKLLVQSGMHYSEGVLANNYENLLITIPISNKISRLTDIKVVDSKDKSVGIGQYDETNKILKITLTEAVKNTENLVITYKATVKEDAKTDDVIDTEATMKADYLVNGTNQVINRKSNKVNVVVAGGLSVTSRPETIDFGKVTYKAKAQTVEDPIVSNPLIVTDTRSNNQSGWVLSAVVTTPLTANNEELEGEIIYRKNGKDLELSTSQIIYEHQANNDVDVNITNTWGKTAESDGVKLKFKSSDMMKTGDYAGKIRWTLMPGQP